MKVRTKFTFYIAAASMFAAFFFSFFVIYEVKSESYELNEYEMKEIADDLFRQVEQSENELYSMTGENLSFPMRRYWMRLINAKQETIFETPLAKEVDLPIAEGESRLITHQVQYKLLWLPIDERIELPQDGSAEIPFQTKSYAKNIGGETYTIQMARPLFLLHSELQELAWSLIAVIAVTAAVIFIVSMLISDRMLKPLQDINKMIKDIRETSLNKRIPLQKSKDELYELSTALNSMFDRLYLSFQKQREFIGNASHEMKSPLTVLMLGHEELMMSDIKEQTRHALAKQLDTMRRLQKLIRDLLSIAQLEQQDKLERKTFSLDQLLLSIIEDYEELTTHKHIRVEKLLLPLTVSADQEKLGRLFINLLDNAIKYNLPVDGFIQIRAEERHGVISVEFENSGPEISPEDCTKIFNQFYRVEKSRSLSFGGSGLGLTIARRIAVLHGGDIKVESSNGVTGFTVTIPVR